MWLSNFDTAVLTASAPYANAASTERRSGCPTEVFIESPAYQLPGTLGADMSNDTDGFIIEEADVVADLC